MIEVICLMIGFVVGAGLMYFYHTKHVDIMLQKFEESFQARLEHEKTKWTEFYNKVKGSNNTPEIK